MSIAGKVVAITGASGGIGRAAARLLAARGAAVVLGARREERLAAVAEEITAAGGRAAHVVTDVTRRHDLQALVGLACDRFVRLDVLVNNAGIGPISRFDALRVDDWDAMIDVNSRVCSTASPRRCRCSDARARVTSSTSCRRPG